MKTTIEIHYVCMSQNVSKVLFTSVFRLMNGKHEVNERKRRAESKLTVLPWTESLRHKLCGC